MRCEDQKQVMGLKGAELLRGAGAGWGKYRKTQGEEPVSPAPRMSLVWGWEPGPASRTGPGPPRTWLPGSPPAQPARERSTG